MGFVSATRWWDLKLNRLRREAERTDLWHMFCWLYVAVTIELFELSAWESSDSKPQRGTDTPAPQIHARSTADRPDGTQIERYNQYENVNPEWSYMIVLNIWNISGVLLPESLLIWPVHSRVSSWRRSAPDEPRPYWTPTKKNIKHILLLKPCTDCQSQSTYWNLIYGMEIWSIAMLTLQALMLKSYLLLRYDFYFYF